MLGCIQADRGLRTAAGAEIQLPFMTIGHHRATITTMVAHCPPVFVVDSVFENKRLIIRFDIFLIGKVALVQHFTQDALLTVAVSPGAVSHFPLVHIHTGGIGVKQRGVIGDTDQAGAFRNGKALKFFAEIGCRRGLDSVASFAQIDSVQIFLHNDILVILLFQELRAEYLHHFSLNRDTLFISGIFNQLLGNGRATELGIAAEEHISTGFHCCDPVNTLMLVKTFVLNRNRRINQRLGDLIPGCGLTIGGCIDLLKKLDITVIIHVMDIGSFLNIIILIGPVLSFLQNVILKILRQRSSKNHSTDQTDQQHRSGRSNRNFCRG